MAGIVGQLGTGSREQSQRDVPEAENRQPVVQNTNEEEDGAQENVSCFKEVVPNSNRQLDSQQQRDVAVLMGDTPSPAPSVISIHSEATDGEEDGEDEEPQRCRLRE